MSLLAAAVPVAVLVLAWDETSPAVRALVEATETSTPTLDSVVVLVPAETGESTQEEFLPLPAEPTLLPTEDKQTSLLLETTPAVTEEALFPNPVPAEQTVAPTSSVTKLPAPGALADTPLPVPEPPLAPVPAPPAWAAVRVLRLSSYSLPELTALSNQALPQPIWQSSLAPPAAPYLGSQSAAFGSEALSLRPPAQPEAANAAPSLSEGLVFPLSPTLAGATQPEEHPLPALPIALAPDYLTDESPVPALDAEADLAPILPDELVTRADAPTGAPLAEAPVDAQTDWTEALASLRTPLPIEEPAPATDFEDEATYYAATTSAAPSANVSAGPTELRPPSQPFEAPDLNFQVIQYARFAVPVALAQAPFSAIYAPAWPTWLAAQELRYRTRQPLVLHVATLAASIDDSLETATGWQAELQRQALHRADLILAETHELTRRLRHDLGLPPELVRTVAAADAAAVAQALRTAQVRPSVSAA